MGVSVFYERSAVFLFRSSFFVFMKNCGVNPELAGERDFIKAASLLGLLDITEIYVIENELSGSGISTSDFVMPVTILNEKSFYEYLRSFTDVMML